MKKQILNLGKILTKLEQKNFHGGGRCDWYTGPTYYDENMCRDYHSLPHYNQICVKVSHECFPR